MNHRAAIWYAQRGLYVLPVSREKRPLITGGVHSASIDPKVISQWFAQWPDANVAVAAGPHSGILVIDVDPRNGGFDTIANVEFDHEPLITTKAITGSGGEHYVYRWPCIPAGHELRGKLGDGVDILGAGKYFLVWPSASHAGPYRWVGRRPFETMADVPQWLLPKILRPITPVPMRDPIVTPTVDVVERARRYLEATPPAVSGRNGSTHTFVVCQRLVHGFGLDELTAYQLVTAWNTRCIPPWSPHALRRKISEAARKGHYSRSLLHRS